MEKNTLDPEDGGYTDLRNVGIPSQHYTASQPRKLRILKGKVKVVPVLTKAPRIGDVLGEWRYISTHPLTSALQGSEWLVSRSRRFTPRERDPGTHWIGG
jgi:hypothetical protein